ncbi:uncharacterized protein LOC142574041 [Dermacentor variabilis]|uniref:uncharacterized protein LOC142574041 n=1 Tax=Dermacentor variabilis TaxID=34621 RepID=UPI003F5C3205
MADITSLAGKNKVELYWTKKKIYHYAVFDIGVMKNETGQEKTIVEAAFNLLREFRNLQQALKTNNPSQTKPDRGFIVASFYLWPGAETTPLKVFTENVVRLPLDAIIILTHLTVDELEAGLPCVITGGAPYDVKQVTNILGMEVVMKNMAKQKQWVTNTTLTVSVSLCTRLYMPVKGTDLEEKCVDHMHRPNTTAAFCNDHLGIYANPETLRLIQRTVKSSSRGRPPLVATFDTNETVSSKYCKLRREFEDIPFGLSLFDLECEDWANSCNAMNTPMPGTQRFKDMTAHFATLSTKSVRSLPC